MQLPCPCSFSCRVACRVPNRSPTGCLPSRRPLDASSFSLWRPAVFICSQPCLVLLAQAVVPDRLHLFTALPCSACAGCGARPSASVHGLALFCLRRSRRSTRSSSCHAGATAGEQCQCLEDSGWRSVAALCPHTLSPHVQLLALPHCSHGVKTGIGLTRSGLAVGSPLANCLLLPHMCTHPARVTVKERRIVTVKERPIVTAKERPIVSVAFALRDQCCVVPRWARRLRTDWPAVFWDAGLQHSLATEFGSVYRMIGECYKVDGRHS